MKKNARKFSPWKGECCNFVLSIVGLFPLTPRAKCNCFLFLVLVFLFLFCIPVFRIRVLNNSFNHLKVAITWQWSEGLIGFWRKLKCTVEPVDFHFPFLSGLLGLGKQEAALQGYPKFRFIKMQPSRLLLGAFQLLTFSGV